MDKSENLQKARISPSMPGVASGDVFCPDCGNTGIVGDEGPGRRNARHEWVPCDCPKGDSHRPRRIDRFQPDWTDVEMDAISDMAKAKEMSQKAVIRSAVRLYQAVHAGARTVVWPCAHGEGQNLECSHGPNHKQ